MAIVKFGTGVDGIRGSIGGVTFSAAGAGPYVKAWRSPVVRRSERAAQVRERFGTSAPGWRDITGAQRQDWRDWAGDPAQTRYNSLGEPYNLLGWQAYGAISIQLQSVGRPPAADAPTVSAPPDPTVMVIVAEVASGVPFLQVTLYTGDFPTGGDVVLFLWVGPRGTRTVPAGRGLLAYGDEIAAGNVLDLTDRCEALFGPIQVGQQIFVGIAAQEAEGPRSGLYWDSATVVEV